MTWWVACGDNRQVLRALADASVDSVVCDPPYELGFMGKRWDASGIAYDVDLWREVLRALKPGGHLLAFGGTRTYHRMTCAIEDAGFEIRDSIHWLYGSGFPKSLDVSKAIDKSSGVWRGRAGKVTSTNGAMGGPNYERTDKGDPITEAARQWAGWGTALKPAHEPCVVARKPLEGTVAANVLAHGTGAINVDGCRIEGPPSNGGSRGDGMGFHGGMATRSIDRTMTQGRWPANVVLDEDAGRELDEQSGLQAARFFYCAKASKADRDQGCEGLERKNNMRVNGPRESEEAKFATLRSNHHPTVKPTSLMRWLVRLVTPPGGIVLDPFTGSGSTGVAAVAEGFRFAGIELSEEYVAIARARIAAARVDGAQLELATDGD